MHITDMTCLAVVSAPDCVGYICMFVKVVLGILILQGSSVKSMSFLGIIEFRISVGQARFSIIAFSKFENWRVYQTN